MTESIKYTFTDQGFTKIDFNDVFVRRDFFSPGQLWGWGDNTCYPLGTTVSSYGSPVQTISGGGNWLQVSSGSGGETAAIKTDGTLWLWGLGQYGELGDNCSLTRDSPVQTVSSGNNWRQVSVSKFQNVAAIKTDGTLWAWGKSYHLGNESVFNNRNFSSPVQTVSGGTDWKFVSAGFQVMGAVKTDGTLWIWGRGGQGALGNSCTINRSSPVQTISAGTNWKTVSIGFSSTAIKTDGTLWLWGCGINGVLGNQSTINHSSPIQTVSGGTNWRQAFASKAAGATKIDGTLWMWGDNSGGFLGDNTTISKSSPVQTISATSDWKIVDGDIFHTVSLKNNGTLWTWGCGLRGALGQGPSDLVSRSSPIQTITGGSNWTKIAAGDGIHNGITMAIKDLDL